MGDLVALFEPFDAHVGVNLGGAKTCVTEQLLNRAEVSSPVEQMGCRAVPQRVWARDSGRGFGK